MFRKIAIAVITVATAAGFMIGDATIAAKVKAATVDSKPIVQTKRVRHSRSADIARSRVMRMKAIKVARISTKNRRSVPLPRPAPNKNPAS